jgi:hypothetical protein
MVGQLLQLGLLCAANVVALHAVFLQANRARVGQQSGSTSLPPVVFAPLSLTA